MKYKEVWKWVKYKGVDYTNLYKVSNKGRLKSYHKSKKGVLLKPAKHYKRGYLSFALAKNKNKKTASIHTLVALMFIGEIPKGYEVDHKNSIVNDNKYSNLQIITHRKNTSLEKTLKSGLPVGVTFYKQKGLYLARISSKAYGNDCLYLGQYDTASLASTAYQYALAVINDDEMAHPIVIRNNVNLFRSINGLPLIRPYDDVFLKKVLKLNVF